MIGMFIFALQVFGLICGYTHQTSLKTTSNFSLCDSFLPANLKGIDIRIVGSFWSHVQVNRCSSRRRRGRHVRRCASNKYLYLCILLLLVSNDIHRNPGPPLGKNTLNISSFNARSIVNKRLELQSHVVLMNPDIIAITETLSRWASEDHIHTNINSTWRILFSTCLSVCLHVFSGIPRDTPGQASFFFFFLDIF